MVMMMMCCDNETSGRDVVGCVASVKGSETVVLVKDKYWEELGTR